MAGEISKRSVVLVWALSRVRQPCKLFMVHDLMCIVKWQNPTWWGRKGVPQAHPPI